MSIGFQNIWRMGYGTALHRAFGVRRPLNVMLSLTDRCTCLCKYCRIPLRKSPEMSLDQLIALFGQMRRAGTARLGLWGGEPLVRRDIGDILVAAKDKGFYVSVDTNGELVSQKLTELESADHVVVSLDGRKENHDGNRHAGAHDAALEAIRALSLRNKRVWTISVLTRRTIHDVDYILDLAREHGFMATFQILHHNAILGTDTTDLAPDDHDLRQTIKYLIQAKLRGAPIANTIHYLKYIRGWPDFSRPASYERVGWLPCFAGDLFCNIDTNGDLFPCSLLVGQIPARNVLTSGFSEAFKATSRKGCESCAASCYVEYNHLHSLNPAAVWDFGRSVGLKG